MKFFFDQSCSPLDAEHRYVCGLVKWLSFEWVINTWILKVIGSLKTINDAHGAMARRQKSS